MNLWWTTTLYTTVEWMEVMVGGGDWLSREQWPFQRVSPLEWCQDCRKDSSTSSVSVYHSLLAAKCSLVYLDPMSWQVLYMMHDCSGYYSLLVYNYFVESFNVYDYFFILFGAQVQQTHQCLHQCCSLTFHHHVQRHHVRVTLLGWVWYQCYW